ncbi:MAG: hypothetical protein F4X13_08910 [Gammaproteobacteria bacterium]|nr:hypothetical protein [Gammaproteobacteria bacterium]
MAIKYELPPFLDDAVVTRQVYVRWLHRKARAHARRDRRRWNLPIRVSSYKQAIHRAVLESSGRDFYTHEELDWSLISQYDNRDSQSQGVKYKKRLALLPTVDHADPESKQADFRICGWRTNDCKNDLTMAELRDFCETFLGAQAAGWKAKPAGLLGRRA